MTDFGATLLSLGHAHRMNALYALTALCIIFKMAFIVREIPLKGTLATNILRVMCAVVATIVAIKALARFNGGDTAEWFDIIRELSWCSFLVAATVVLKERFGRY